MLDAEKHGRDNIFRRSGRDILTYEPVQATLRMFHLSIRSLNAGVMGALNLGLVVVALFAGLWLLNLLRKIIAYFAN